MNDVSSPWSGTRSFGRKGGWQMSFLLKNPKFKRQVLGLTKALGQTRQRSESHQHGAHASCGRLTGLVAPLNSACS